MHSQNIASLNKNHLLILTSILGVCELNFKACRLTEMIANVFKDQKTETCLCRGLRKTKRQRHASVEG